jgi:phytanoyl-CoA hydroxylase
MTTVEIEKYRRDGFLVLEDFVSGEACDALRARAAELVRDFDPAGMVSIFSTHEQTRSSDEYFLGSGDRIRFFFEENAFNSDGTLKQSKEQSINKIGHALHDLDPVFDRFSRARKIEEMVLQLGIAHPLLLQSMYIFKQPRIGGEVSCHQDATFLYTEPLRMVGLWFALEDASVENGCLWAIPGGHKLGLKSRFVRLSPSTDRLEAGYRPRPDSTDRLEAGYPPHNSTDRLEAGYRPPVEKTRFEILDESPWPEEELKPLEVKKGTLIVLDPLLPHLSRENRSPKSRHAYTLHVIDASTHYPKENWLQRSRQMPPRGFQGAS